MESIVISVDVHGNEGHRCHVKHWRKLMIADGARDRAARAQRATGGPPWVTQSLTTA